MIKPKKTHLPYLYCFDDSDPTFFPEEDVSNDVIWKEPKDFTDTLPPTPKKNEPKNFTPQKTYTATYPANNDYDTLTLSPGRYLYCGYQIIDVDSDGNTIPRSSTGAYLSIKNPSKIICEDTTGKLEHVAYAMGENIIELVDDLLANKQPKKIKER